MSEKQGFKHLAWNSIEREQLNDAIGRQMIAADQLMLARIYIKKGGRVPKHHHHNEQITYVLEGSLTFSIDGRELNVKAGEMLCIPSNMPHEAWAPEDTVELDVFTPPREDWLNKTDDYLRGK